MTIESFKNITESMFYVLMALIAKDSFGVEMVEFISKQSKGRIMMGPGTLYTILAKFEEAKIIEEIAVEGRKRTYRITDLGRHVYTNEITRLKEMLEAAQSLEEDYHED